MKIGVGSKEALVIGLTMSGVAWSCLLTSDAETFWLWHWQHSPNRYRLLQQLFLLLNGHPLSLGQLMTITWGLSMVALMLVMAPDRSELVPLLVVTMMMSAQLLILSAPAYVLLAVLCRYKDHRFAFLLVPMMTVLKEFLGFAAVVALLASGNRCNAVLGAALSAAAYAAVWLLMGPSDTAPGGTPLVTFFYMIGVLQTSWAISATVFTAVIIAAFALLVRNRSDALLVAVLVAPIFVFGFFWEPQLWLPAMIVLVYRTRWNREAAQAGARLTSDTAIPQP